MASNDRIEIIDGTTGRPDNVELGTYLTGSIPVATAVDPGLMSAADKTKLDAIIAPFLFKGAIAIAADFPAPGDVETGWTYRVTANVTDNDPTKTNTGQSFLAEDEIAWNGTDWTLMGNASTPAVEAALLSIMTTNEDILIRRAGALARLGIGAVGDVLGNVGGALTYFTPSAAEPKATYVWRIDADNGNDGTGDGSFDAPLLTTQRAIVLAHAVDIGLGSPAHHVFSYAPGTYGAPGADPTTYFGSNDGVDNWSLDAPDYMTASLVGDGGEEPERTPPGKYTAGIMGPGAGAVDHGPIANLPAAGAFGAANMIQISNMRIESDVATSRPPLVTMGKCFLDRVFLTTMPGTASNALWLGYWDGSGPIGALAGEQVNFTMKDTGIYCHEDTFPAILADMIGSFDSHQSQISADSTPEVVGGAISMVGNAATDVFLRDSQFTAGVCNPAVNLLDINNAEILGCEFAGSRDATSKSLLVVDPKDWCHLDRNHFSCFGVGLDDTPGNNAVVIVTDDQPNVYWGTNTDAIRAAGAPMKEVFHTVTDVLGLENWFYTKRVVNKQVWIMGVPYTYGIPQFSLGPAASQVYRVVGNGSGGADTREPLPIELVEISSPNVQVELARLPVGGGPAPGSVSVEWLDYGGTGSQMFDGIRITNLSAAPATYRLIIPGAILVSDPVPPVP